MSIDLTEPRPSTSPELMAILRDRFGLDPLAEPTDLGGSYSLNLRVDTSDGSYVARVYGTQTGSARLRAIQDARRYLARGSVPTALSVLAGDNRPFINLKGHLVEVERYVEHDANMDTWLRLERGLPYLGRIHALFQSFRPGLNGRFAPLANHIEPHQALAGSLQGIQRMRSWALAPDELALAQAYEELAHLVHRAERNLIADLPRQMVHGDFWDNNVLFRGNEVVLVADLDFMAERLRIDDLALTLYFANSSLAGETLSPERMLQLRGLVDAYDSGLSSHLTETERLALPAAIARQTLWTIGRGVPDLPDPERARKLARSRAVDAEWTLEVMHNLQAWQQVFAE